MPHNKIQSGAINIQENGDDQTENDKTGPTPSQISNETPALVSIANQTHSGGAGKASIGSQKVSSRNQTVGPAGSNHTIVNPKSRLNFIDRSTDTTGDILIRRMKNPRFDRLAYGNF